MFQELNVILYYQLKYSTFLVNFNNNLYFKIYLIIMYLHNKCVLRVYFRNFIIYLFDSNYYLIYYNT